MRKKVTGAAVKGGRGTVQYNSILLDNLVSDLKTLRPEPSFGFEKKIEGESKLEP